MARISVDAWRWLIFPKVVTMILPYNSYTKVHHIEFLISHNTYHCWWHQSHDHSLVGFETQQLILPELVINHIHFHYVSVILRSEWMLNGTEASKLFPRETAFTGESWAIGP